MELRAAVLTCFGNFKQNETVNEIPSGFRLWSKVLRLCPLNVPGKTRIAKTFLRAYSQLRDVPLQDRHGNRFFVPNFHDPIAFHLLIDGVYEPLTLKFILGRLKPGMTFVDIGASIGVFTIPVARNVGPIGRVLAVEPSPKIFPYLEINVRENNLSNVRLKQCAAYDYETQSLSFYEAPPKQFGMGSLAPQFHDRPVAVQTQTLDQILVEEHINHVDLVKVDVEGFEAAVFRGAKQLLTRQLPPLVIFEFCDWAERRACEGEVGDAQRMLMEWGYQIWRLSDLIGNDGKPLQDLLVRGYEMLVAIRK